jgi:hypothetical protein
MNILYLPFEFFLEINLTRWLNDNIGNTVSYREIGVGMYGFGWEIYPIIDNITREYKWVIKIDHENDATLFKLRWQ